MRVWEDCWTIGKKIVNCSAEDAWEREANGECLMRCQTRDESHLCECLMQSNGVCISGVCDGSVTLHVCRGRMEQRRGCVWVCRDAWAAVGSVQIKRESNSCSRINAAVCGGGVGWHNILQRIHCEEELVHQPMGEVKERLSLRCLLREYAERERAIAHGAHRDCWRKCPIIRD